MRISIVCVGRLKERFWSDAAREYLDRLRPYASVRVIEVPDRDHTGLGTDRALSLEAADIRRTLPTDAHVVCLDRSGAAHDSESFASWLADRSHAGSRHLVFVIGGSVGLAPEVLQRADEVVSLGPLTFPHNLARIIVLEQLYRAFKICRGEPYHK